MNPFERIEEMKQVLKAEVRNNKIKGNDYITQAEHYSRMMNMLTILEEEMKDAEYNYEIESVNHSVKTFNEMTVLQKELNDDIIIFQPVVGEEVLSSIDMQSLADVLKILRDNGEIKENIIILPPNINVFRAKLALPCIQEDEE